MSFPVKIFVREAHIWIGGASLGLLLTLVLPTPPLSAQERTHWVVPTTIGFGGLGLAAAYGVWWAAEREEEMSGSEDSLRRAGWSAATLATFFLGGRLGYQLGTRVDNKLAEGIEPDLVERRGVRLGTVLAGATLGSLVSLIHADVRDGSDARLISTYALAGAALGGVVQLAWDRHLYPRVPPSTPRIGVTPDGGLFVGLTFRF